MKRAEIWESIKSKGREYRALFPDVDFIGEIDVAEEELNELSRHLWNFAESKTNDRDFGAALTVFVVNLAYFNRTSIESNSFRWYVLRTLSGRDVEDVKLWQDAIGSVTERVLKEHFNISPVPGPHRYVRPLLQQAGIPLSLHNQFAEFFFHLYRAGGLSFSSQDYRKYAESGYVHSPILSAFLSTEFGFRYCVEVGRFVGLIRGGIINAQEIENLPHRFREAVRTCANKIEGEPVVRKTSDAAEPRMRIDAERNRLMLSFPVDGISKQRIRHYLESGEECRQSETVIEPGYFQDGLISGHSMTNGRRVSWQIDAWNPDRGHWAVFSSSTGVLEQYEGSVAPGEYLIAIDSRFEPTGIIEDLSYLNYPATTAFKIYRANLEAGFCVPEIGLEVSNHKSSVPRITIAGDNRLEYGINCFVGKPPSVVIENWRTESAREFLVHGAINGTAMRFDDYMSTGGSIRIETAPPAHVEINVEPKTRTRRAVLNQKVSFVLIPDGLSCRWENRLYEALDQPKFDIVGSDDLIVETSSGAQSSALPVIAEPNSASMSLELRVKNGPRFAVYVPIYRFSVSGELLDGDILNHDSLYSEGSITLSLSPRERGRSVEFGLLTPTGFHSVIETGKTPRIYSIDLTAKSVRDGFEDCGLPGGILAVRLPDRSVVRSKGWYVNRKLLDELPLSVTDPESWSDFLPESEIEAIRRVRAKFLHGRNDRPEEKEDVAAHDPQTTLVASRQIIREWAKHCLKGHFQRAGADTIFGSSDEGRKLTEAVRTYRDGLAKLKGQNEVAFRNFLETAYRMLDEIAGVNGLIPQTATYLRFLCCLRLGQVELAADEVQNLDHSWQGVLSDIASGSKAAPVGDAAGDRLLRLADVKLDESDEAWLEQNSGRFKIY